ncbi:hypothetical protein C9374_006944 [Naegleria lovaniensis]|uniref:1-phosphatidylinositol-3-phosphate 5-kinase n=1 Tax=Naegleria lovaniensis TaxID=51637 RepID=A0AA88KPQ3_NAELO|nr:uncharacterized protein C9374_006944 [Naegleria lovaniensis]KAG2393413.1 hypothetical protein C9374_006944 [Naegleria lovaniensis]
MSPPTTTFTGETSQRSSQSFAPTPRSDSAESTTTRHYRSVSNFSTTSSIMTVTDSAKPKLVEFTTNAPGGQNISSFLSKIFNNPQNNSNSSSSTLVANNVVSNLSSPDNNYFFYENPSNQSLYLYVSNNPLKLSDEIPVKKTKKKSASSFKSMTNSEISEEYKTAANNFNSNITNVDKQAKQIPHQPNNPITANNHEPSLTAVSFDSSGVLNHSENHSYLENPQLKHLDFKNIDHIISTKKRSMSISKDNSGLVESENGAGSSYVGFSLVNKKELLKMENRVDLQSRHNTTPSDSLMNRSKSHPELFTIPEATTDENSEPSPLIMPIMKQDQDKAPTNTPIDSPRKHYLPNQYSQHQPLSSNVENTSSISTQVSSNHNNTPNTPNMQPYYSSSGGGTPEMSQHAGREKGLRNFISNTLQRKSNARQFWMPDDRVTNCYECLTPFSVFKRKHHCRICGQIFCWKCSDYFIDGKKWGYTGKMRVCNYCNNLVGQSQNLSQILNGGTSNAPSSAALTSSFSSTSTTLNTSTQTNHASSNNNNNMLNNSPVPNSTGQSSQLNSSPSGILAPHKSFSSFFSSMDEFGAKGLAEGLDTDPDDDDEQQDKVSTNRENDGNAPNDASSSDDDEDDDDNETNDPSIRRRRLRIHTNSLNPTTIFDDSLLMNNSDFTMAAASEEADNHTHSQGGGIDGTVPFKIISGEEFEQGFDEHLNSLEEVSQKHLKAIVSQLIQRENAMWSSSHTSTTQVVGSEFGSITSSTPSIDPKWEEVIVGLALRTVNSLNPNILRGDKMDIRNCLKVKKVLGSNMSKSEYVDGGVVFSKNVVHKRMKTNLKNPKLLILSCPIAYQYHKAETQSMTSMDILISQEEEFLKLLVERIAEKKPDLVFVEKSVSRFAKELLLSKGIAVVVNVKRKVLERISKCTGYPILSSIDEYDQSILHMNLNQTPPPQCTHAYMKRIGNKNLFIVCGKYTDAQSTVVLRGEDEKELELVKPIFKFAVYVAYNLKLETEFFFDECGTLRFDAPTSTNSPYILSASPNVKFSLRLEDLDLAKLGIVNPIQTLTHREKAVHDYYYSDTTTATTTPSSSLTGMDNNNNPYTETELAIFGDVLSPYVHQNIIVLFTKHPKVDPKLLLSSSSLITETQSLANPETVVIAYYTDNDMPLGKFLELKCFNPNNILNYMNTTRMYTHGDGKIILTVEKSPQIISSSDEGIAMWNYCKICERHVTPVIPMSESAYKYSFGKFLESTFYNSTLRCRTGGCNHSVHHDHIRYFAYNDVIAKFEYKPVKIYDIVFPGNRAVYDETYQASQFTVMVQNVEDACNVLFADFMQLVLEIESNFSLLSEEQIEQFHEIGEQIKNQQNILWSSLSTIKQKQNIYTLNDFIRNVYISTISWNDMIIELFSKFGILKSTTSSGVVANSMSSSATTVSNTAMKTAMTKSKPVVLKDAPCSESSSSPSSNHSNGVISHNSNNNSGHISSVLTSSNPRLISVEFIINDTSQQEHKPLIQVILKRNIFLTSITLSSMSSNSDNESAITTPSSYLLPVVEPLNLDGIESTTATTTTTTTTTTTLRNINTCGGIENNSSSLEFNTTGMRNNTPHSVVNTTITLSTANTSSSDDASSPLPSSGRSQKGFSFLPFRNQNKQSTIFDQLQLKPVKLPAIIDGISAHLFLPSGSTNANVIVYNDEPSTIIAYTLSSTDYDKVIRSNSEHEDIEMVLKSKEKNHYKFSFSDTSNSNSGNKVTLIDGEIPFNNSSTSMSNRSKNKTKFSCTCFFAKQFLALRKAYCDGDDSFIHSLVRCVKWNTTGGKSGSSFTKTWDSKYVLKEVNSRVELLSFLEIGHAYFEYVASSLFQELPSVLCKILGVFRLSYYEKGKSVKKDIIVMDNLFYNRVISRTFDLKGSIRNRYQKTEGAVLMDENLLEFIYNGSPLITRESFKSILTLSVFNDTLFLSKHNIMDYSLLVGIDEENGELIVGIIDYELSATNPKYPQSYLQNITKQDLEKLCKDILFQHAAN